MDNSIRNSKQKKTKQVNSKFNKGRVPKDRNQACSNLTLYHMETCSQVCKGRIMAKISFINPNEIICNLLMLE